MVSYDDMVFAAFVVRDGWYGGQWSPSYAFQCGDFSRETVEGTLAELESAWRPIGGPLDSEGEEAFVAYYDLSDAMFCDYLVAVDTLRKAVASGWEVSS